MTPKTLARLKLVAVFAVFLVPLAGAYLLYYGLSYGSAGANAGELVSPAKPLPALALQDATGSTQPSGKVFEQAWTILQVAPDGCGTACQKSLDKTRQVRALLHRRITRVQRLLLTDSNQPMPKLKGQADVSIYRTDIRRLIDVFEQVGANAPGVVYLVDPLGNWMLYYPPDGDGEPLFKDIKHLLKLSHIG